jgi:hypothetical protein
MKIVLELLLCILLHPIATILVWIDLAGRGDLGVGAKVGWGIGALLWPLAAVYVLAGGNLW